MMHRIAAVSHYPDLPYTVTLIHTNIVNAACAPGGQIIFWEGLYDPKIGMVQNDNELAAVMAHEIAHATARHTTKTLTRHAPYSVALAIGALAAELTDNRDLALAMGAAFVLYQGVLLPKYSREHEYEADRLGLLYMADAGYDPRAAPALWRRMHSQSNNPSFAHWFASHPSHRDRYRALESMMPEALERYEASPQRNR
jgi:predicted Zn-dependent protease